MYNEGKFQKCINHLVHEKIVMVIYYIIIFAIIGFLIGLWGTKYFEFNYMTMWCITGGCSVIGLIIGLSNTWKIEKEIQEAYWKVSVLKELKKQSSNKTIAKTVVAIENKQESPSSKTYKK